MCMWCERVCDAGTCASGLGEGGGVLPWGMLCIPSCCDSVRGLHHFAVAHDQMEIALTDATSRGGASPRFCTRPPPSRNGPKAPRGGGGRHWRGGSGRAMGGGEAVGRVGWGGGSRWGDLGWGGGAQSPVTSPCPPSGVRARARVRTRVGVRVRVRVTELVEPVLVL